ncbi:NAD(P)/FAD-dependent oxidoreductase [Natranaerobius trueperi]|uniref:Geranylgeranyl reductase n=1 Tax=Natranaerobius trueperi TaxID=759412 RepID=A0A226BXD1_9FIRM|nr:NAD(P)/FAD-dependent oxidoreductase [Natranaerobius trueperi]OWZ83432.1 geranylgeranyl reductase [Natranaerobius trueperi]
MVDIAIIGGGPAGLSAAISSRNKGLNVTLFEKTEIGSNLKCAEGFYDSLKMLGKPCAGVLNKVDRLHLELNQSYKLDASDMNLWMIDRATWQKTLKEIAINKGVKIFENTIISAKQLINLKEKYDWVIDCTGVPSVTSLAYNFNKEYQKDWAYAHQVTVSGNFSSLLGELKVGVNSNFIGYYWIFPKTSSKANIGLGLFPQNRKYPENLQTNLKEEVNQILKREGLSDVNITKRNGGLIPTRPLDKLVYDNILLAGDSGGFSSPLHGEGIDLAILSGREAVDTILEKDTSNYHSRLQKLFGAKFNLERRILKLWEHIGFENLDLLLKIIIKKDSISEIPRLFKYRSILFEEYDNLTNFYNGFFYGRWKN